MKDYLSDEVYIVKPVEENEATWVAEGKDGRIRWEGTSVSYDVPLTSNGVKKILEAEEQLYLEKKIDPTRPQGWLGPYVKAGNAWTGKGRYKVTITPEGLELHMDNPIDYIKRKILLANTEDIAPSYSTRLDRKYLFYMEAISNIDRTRTDKLDKKLRAMGHIASIQDDSSRMRNMLLVLYKGKRGKVPLDADASVFKTMLAEYAEMRLDAFLSVLDDPEYKYKVYYYLAIEKGAFVMENYQLRASYQNGKLIGNTIEDGIAEIKAMAEDSSRNEEYGIFKKRIKR